MPRPRWLRTIGASAFAALMTAGAASPKTAQAERYDLWTLKEGSGAATYAVSPTQDDYSGAVVVASNDEARLLTEEAERISAIDDLRDQLSRGGGNIAVVSQGSGNSVSIRQDNGGQSSIVRVGEDNSVVIDTESAGEDMRIEIAGGAGDPTPAQQGETAVYVRSGAQDESESLAIVRNVSPAEAREFIQDMDDVPGSVKRQMRRELGL